MRAISAVAASSIRWFRGMHPLPPSQALAYARTVKTFERTPSEVTLPGTFVFSKSAAATRTSSRRMWYCGAGNSILRTCTSEDTYLIGTQHMLIEDLMGNLVDQRMGNPGSVMPIGDFSKLVRADLVHRDFVCLLVVLDGNLSRHPTNGGHLASGNSMLGLNLISLTSKAYLWQV